MNVLLPHATPTGLIAEMDVQTSGGWQHWSFSGWITVLGDHVVTADIANHCGEEMKGVVIGDVMAMQVKIGQLVRESAELQRLRA